MLCKAAIDEEWRESNPTIGIKKLTGGDYEPWPVELQLLFIEYCEEHALRLERLLFELAVGSGQRLGDLLEMTWKDYDGEFIHVVQEKTKAKLWVACPDFLIEYLDSIPEEGTYIISQTLHKGYKKRTIQRRIEDIRKEIGAEKYVPHGWRYTVAIELAEAGCTDSEIQAVTGHKSRTERETAKQIAKPQENQNNDEEK